MLDGLVAFFSRQHSMINFVLTPPTAFRPLPRRAKVVITASGVMRGTKPIPLKGIVDAAVAQCAKAGAPVCWPGITAFSAGMSSNVHVILWSRGNERTGRSLRLSWEKPFILHTRAMQFEALVLLTLERWNN